MLRPILLVASLFIVALPGYAQTEDGRPLARFRMDQLQQSVGLPEFQARAVVDRWARYDQDQFETTRQIQQLRHRFNDILLGPGTEEDKNAKVRPLLEQFVELLPTGANLLIQARQFAQCRNSDLARPVNGAPGFDQ